MKVVALCPELTPTIVARNDIDTDRRLKGEKMTVRTQQQDGGMGNSNSTAGYLVSLVVWLGYKFPEMKAIGRALRMIPPPPIYTVNRALGEWTDPGPVSAFATCDPIHIVQCTF